MPATLGNILCIEFDYCCADRLGYCVSKPIVPCSGWVKQRYTDLSIDTNYVSPSFKDVAIDAYFFINVFRYSCVVAHCPFDKCVVLSIDSYFLATVLRWIGTIAQ